MAEDPVLQRTVGPNTPTTKLAFGNKLLGTVTAAKTITLTNRSSTTLNISGISVSGDFAISSKTCGTTLAVSASCNVKVTFKSTAVGLRTGVLSFADDAAGSPQTVSLSGTGVAISLTPATTSFGSVTVGTTSTGKIITVSNASTSTVTFTGFSITGGKFELSGDGAV